MPPASRSRTSPVSSQALNTDVGPLEAQGVNVTLALAQILGRARLTFRSAQSAIVVSAVLGLPACAGIGRGGRPGVSTGTGNRRRWRNWGGVGSGASTGVSGGVAGGVPGGVSGGVSGGVVGGVSGGVTGGVPGGVVGGVPAETWRRGARPGRRTPCASAATSSRRPRSVDVKPVYPEIARTARVQGVVICEALIGPDGKVADAHILRSIPLLDQAALDAVRPVGIHADTAQRQPGPGHHDDDGELHARRWRAEHRHRGRDSGRQRSTTSRAGQCLTDWPADAIRVGGNIKPPTKIVDVKPVYPDDCADRRACRASSSARC